MNSVRERAVVDEAPNAAAEADQDLLAGAVRVLAADLGRRHVEDRKHACGTNGRSANSDATIDPRRSVACVIVISVGARAPPAPFAGAACGRRLSAARSPT